MQNEEQIFDFMAAAEDTGKQLDKMAKRLPGEMKAVLAEEWRRSPWLAELPKAAEKTMEATKQTEAATRFLARTVKYAGLIVCLAAFVIPSATWVLAHWNLSDLREEQSRLEQSNIELEEAVRTAAQTERAMADEITRRKNEIAELSCTVKLLRDETGGIEVVNNGNGSWEVMLPANITPGRPWRNRDGRFVVPYVVTVK
jgi:hypothetical protein